MNDLRKRKLKRKRIFILSGSLIVLLFFVITMFINKNIVIQNIKIVFRDSANILTKDYILHEIDTQKIINQSIKIDLDIIKKKLEQSNWIADATPYLSNETLNIKILFNTPVAKIITDDNQMFYLNQKSELMEPIKYRSFNVPLFINYKIKKNDSIGIEERKKISLLSQTIYEKEQNEMFKNRIDYLDCADTKDVLLYATRPKVIYHLGNLNGYDKIWVDKIYFFQNYMDENSIFFKEVKIFYDNQIVGIN